MTAGCNFACYKSNLQSFTFHAPTPSNPHPPHPEPALSRFFPLFIFFCLLRMCVSHSKKIPEKKKQSFSSRPAEIRFMKEINILKKKKNSTAFSPLQPLFISPWVSEYIYCNPLRQILHRLSASPPHRAGLPVQTKPCEAYRCWSLYADPPHLEKWMRAQWTG